MAIDFTKPVQTRDGRAVRIYATDGGGEYPVHMATRDSDGMWYPGSRTEDGRVHRNGDSPLDLINVPETRTVKAWIVVFDNGSLQPFTDEALAQQYAYACRPGLFAIVPIEFTCTRGQGLPE